MLKKNTHFVYKINAYPDLTFNSLPPFKNEHAINSNATYLSYCIPSEYELIENYEKAKADNFVGWHCHHRLELHPDNSIRYTVESLKKLGLYLKRPASELIFLKIEEHMRIHLKSRFVK